MNCRLGLGTKGVRGIRASLAEPEVVLLILRTKDQAMEIESTTFGTITIDGGKIIMAQPSPLSALYTAHYVVVAMETRP
jgi:hypothetical protein